MVSSDVKNAVGENLLILFLHWNLEDQTDLQTNMPESINIHITARNNAWIFSHVNL